MDSESNSVYTFSLNPNDDYLSTRPVSAIGTIISPSNSEGEPLPQIERTNLISRNQIFDYERELRHRKEEQIKGEQQFKRIYIRQNQEENIVCLAIDGFETALYGFNIVIQEFLERLKSKLICVYIYNSKLNEEYNWRQQKEFVIESFKTKLLTKLTKDNGHLIIQDYNSYYIHPIKQVVSIALKNSCNYLFLGYQGLKTGNYKSSNLLKGVDYLLRECPYPTVIFKEDNIRGVHNKGYKWLIVMDKVINDCFKVIDYFLPLIDIERDFIYGFTLMPMFISHDDIEEKFDKKMEEIGISKERTLYQMEKYEQKPSDIIKDFVNHNEEHYFDFVMFYNNPEKYKILQKNSESLKMIEKLHANICFINGMYWDLMKV